MHLRACFRSELTVYSFKAALYTLANGSNEWQLTTAEEEDLSAQYYIFMEDTTTPKFRIVGWMEESGDVVLNNSLTKECTWIPVNEYFVQYTPANTDNTIGLSFIDIEQAQEASTVVQRIIQNMKGWSGNNNEGTAEDVVDNSIQLAAELKEYLAIVRTHGVSSLEYLKAISFSDVAHVVEDVNSLIPSEEAPCKKQYERAEDHKLNSFLSDADRQSLRLQYAAAQLSEAISKPPPPMRKSYSVPHSPIREEIRRGSAPIGPTPFLRRCSSSLNSSNSSRNSSRRQSLANFDEVEKATMAAVDSNLHEERSPDFLRATFGTYTGVGPRASYRGDDDPISRPFETKQEMHVTFNAELARYEGLPAAWRGLNKQFGLPLDAVPKRKVPGYEEKIPAVLQMMKEYLVHNGGLETEGIFRLAPDKEECSRVKEQINSGLFTGCNDVHIIANLIKVWFRELPISLFNVIPEKIIYQTCELKDASAVLSKLESIPESNRTVILWLLDVMSEVVLHEAKTKMSAKNMAIVLSPNLLSIESDNPMVALTMSQKVAEFTTVLLNARLKLHHGYTK